MGRRRPHGSIGPTWGRTCRDSSAARGACVTELVILDALGLREPARVVDQRLDTFVPKTARKLRFASGAIALVLAVIAGPLVWLGSGARLAAVVVGGLFALVPVAALVARRDATRLCERWRRLPWDQGASFVTENYGLVFLSAEHLALESLSAVFSTAAFESVRYEADSHALFVIGAPTGAGRMSLPRQHFQLSLPRDLDPARAEVLADLMHLLWTREVREPSATARAWLREHL